MSGLPKRFAAEKVLDLPVEEMWKILSNTDHLNRAIGLPAVQGGVPSLNEKGLYREASMKIMGITVKWREYPFQWQRGEGYSVRRVYQTGPFREIVATLDLQPVGSQTKVTLASVITARHVGGLLIRGAVARKALADALRYCESYVSQLKSGRPRIPRPSRNRSAINVPVFKSLLEKLDPIPVEHELIPRLQGLLAEGSDEEVLEIRPFELADEWGAKPLEVLRLCLHATRVGILNLRWELMCPSCRVSKSEAASLRELPSEYHCDLCGLDYKPEFDKYIELRFSVHPQIRKAEASTYCLGSPASAIHVISQKYLEPGESALFKTGDCPSALRLRAVKWNHALEARPVAEGDSRDVTLNYLESGWEQEPSSGPLRFKTISVTNKSRLAAVFVLEDTEWDKKAVTASFVTTLQEFRDLFSSEVLAPGQNVAVQNITLLFTDLKGSTALYEKVGDATAYGQVKKHFDFLMEHITGHHGVLVKTIGDAVMAAFYSREDGLRAALEIQSRVGRFNRDKKIEPPITLKIGLFSGAAVAITANGQIDFFGRTANIAARVQNESLGGDVVLAEEALDDLRVQGLLKEFSVDVERFKASLKGIEHDFQLCRLTVGEAEEKAATGAGLAEARP